VAAAEKAEEPEIDFDLLNDEEKMKYMMGFGGFDSTKVICSFLLASLVPAVCSRNSFELFTLWLGYLYHK
jgi:hypothetical protein